MTNNKVFPKDCASCYDKEWCDNFYGGLGCYYKDAIKDAIIESILKEEEMKMNKENEKEDVVKEPNHYKHGAFETIDEMIIAFGPQRTYDFCIMNAWKYRSRAPYKGNPEQDMKKADQYLKMAKQISDANLNQMFGGPIVLIKNNEERDNA